jgi:hypothetical protein
MQDSKELTLSASGSPFGVEDSGNRSRSASIHIHLATFDQHILGVYDQILFLRLIFRRLGFRFTMGTSLEPLALNLVIEDFRPAICKALDQFHHETGKRISIIATEHLDYRIGRIYSYNELLFVPQQDRDYISHSERARRFAGLVRATQRSRFLFTLGDYPRLAGAEDLFPRCKVERIPFPPLPMEAVRRRLRRNSRHDFVFTGSVTPLRARILGLIGEDFAVAISKIGTNFVDRARCYLSSTLALNIPQYEGWIWSSPMRVLYGLVMGRLTVSLLLEAGSEIDRYTFMLPELSVASLRETLHSAREQHVLATLEEYQFFAENAVRQSGIEDVFAQWAIAEGLL